MRQTIALFGSLLFAGGVLAQQNLSEPNQANRDFQQQEQHSESSIQQNDPALENAPEAVKEQVLRHAAAQDLQELSAENLGGVTVYDATFQGENSKTRLRVAENGAPISLHIAGSEGEIREAAGASRQAGTQQQQQTRSSSSAQQEQSRQQQGVSTQIYGPPAPGQQINEPAGARRDDTSPRTEEERNIEVLRQTQDPGETQGIPAEVRARIQQQLGEVPVENIQPRTFYQLEIRQNGQVQQVWADHTGALLKPQQ